MKKNLMAQGIQLCKLYDLIKTCLGGIVQLLGCLAIFAD